MSLVFAILFSVGICVISAIMEGVLAGKNVKQHLASLRRPSYSMPLWGWYATGVLYYVICGVVLYRIFRHEDDAIIRNIALALLLLIMTVNAFWNWVFFRVRNLFLSFFAFTPYPIFAIALFVCLIQFDQIAAGLILAYLLYLIYGAWWGYRLWKLNRNSN